MTGPTEAAIQTYRLAKSYGRRPALDGIELTVPAGVVFGYLGANGAGKTTTIRILAGLLRPTTGRAEVLGLDTVRDRERIQQRIGYLPGEFVAYPDLTGRQYLDYLANLRGDVDRTVIDGLAARLALDLSLRVGALSHGNRQKLGLIQAFMHDPDVLILDEPSAGLDPLVQREFLSLVRECRDRGRTVFLSSHILSEVETVADVVAIIRQGRLLVVESVDALKAKAVRRLELTFEGTPPLTEIRATPGVRDAELVDQTIQLAVEGSTAQLLRVAAPHGVARIVTHEPDLEDVFLTYYGQES